LGQKIVQIVVVPNFAAYMKMLNLKKDSMGTILGLPQRFLLESAVIRDALMKVACDYLASMATYYKSFASLLKDDSMIGIFLLLGSLPGHRLKRRNEEEPIDDAGPPLHYVHELIRQEAATLASDTSLNETIALSMSISMLSHLSHSQAS
jgi:hypothetical protein